MMSLYIAIKKHINMILLKYYFTRILYKNLTMIYTWIKVSDNELLAACRRANDIES